MSYRPLQASSGTRSVAEPAGGWRESDSGSVVGRILAGDALAFQELFHEHFGRLCSYARGILRDGDAAEEVVEDLFVWIWENREQWEVSSSVRAYLYTAVRNRALAQLRRERMRRRAHDEVAAAPVPPGMAGPRAAADAELEADELAALVERVIAALPERPREAFLLSRRHGLSHAEVAGVMEISVSTVEKHIVRAVAELRRALAERG